MRRIFQLARATGVWAPVTVLLFHQFVAIHGWRTETDWVNHFCGGLSFSFFVWKSLPFLAPWLGNQPPLARLAAAFLAGYTAALIWEIGEFGSDLALGTHIQQSVAETMMDLVNGFLGTTAIVLSAGFLELRRRNRQAGS